MDSPEKNSDAEDAHYEIFVQRFSQYEPDLRRFINSLLPGWSDTDEVLQRAALVIWRKFDQYDPDTNFMKWACVIARFEALAYRRKMARDRLVFSEELLEMMADEGIDEIDERRTELDALEFCLKEIPEKQRQFITLAYTPGVKVKDLAAQAGASAAAYYMRMKRIRRKLMKCVESKIQPLENL